MTKEYEYPEAFETLWDSIKLPKSKTHNKALGYAVYMKFADVETQLKAKTKLIRELQEGVNSCTNCGCIELLCGYRGYDDGCTKEIK